VEKRAHAIGLLVLAAFVAIAGEATFYSGTGNVSGLVIAVMSGISENYSHDFKW
jgi:hypothetical protein